MERARRYLRKQATPVSRTRDEEEDTKQISIMKRDNSRNSYRALPSNTRTKHPHGTFPRPGSVRIFGVTRTYPELVALSGIPDLLCRTSPIPLVVVSCVSQGGWAVSGL